MKNLSKLQASYKRFSKPGLLVLVVLASAAGIYFVFHSFAASGDTPPPSGGYYPVSGIKAAGTPFPSDAECAAQVMSHASAWEPRAGNYAQNHYTPPATMGTFGIYTSTWNSTYLPRIDGNFSGTTDEIMQWAACKWNWSDELIRAESVTESNWYEGQFDSNGAPVNGHGFGDFHPSDVQCPYAMAYLGANNSILTHPSPNPCPNSYGILQNRAYYHPQGFPLVAPPNKSSYPWTSLSTAFAIDEQVAELRGCYDGMSTFLGNTKGDLWGCIQVWFQGSYSAGGGSYSQNVQGNLSSRPWASWADQCSQTPAGCTVSGGGGGDNVAPTASLSTPPASVAGNVAITPTTSDNVGVTKVEFYIDNSLVNTDTGSPFSYTWNTTTAAQGNHSVFVKAYDAAGNVGTSNTVTYNVQNPDTTPPAAPGNVKAVANNPNSVTVTWNAATDPSGIASYKVYRNSSSTPIFTSPNNSTLSFTDTSVAPSNSYSYQVTATDTAGNESVKSASASVTTPAQSDPVNPTATITAPTPNQTVSGTVPVTATASDNVGVVKVEFYIDGILASTATAPASSYSFNWNAGAVSQGTHTIKVVAYDAAGNSGFAQVQVNVQNPVQPLNPPTGVSATAASYNSVSLRWTASSSSGVAGYYILRANSGSVPTTLTSVAATATTYTDPTAQASTAYNYSLEAFDASNNVSAPSNAANVTTPAAPTGDTNPPTAPAGLMASGVSTSQINLSWKPATDNVGVTSYDIYRNGQLLTSLLPPFNANPYNCPSHPTLTTLSSPPASGSTTYICTQRAQWFLNANGASLSVDGWDGNNTTAAIKAYQTKVGLPVTGAVDAATWNSLEASVNISFGDTNLSAGTSYSYYVVAKDAAGNPSAASNTATASTQAPVSNGNISGNIKLSNSSNPYSCPSHPSLSYVSSSPSSGSTTYICTQRVQWFLNTINNARLTVDGWYGNNTTAAVKAYQTRFGLQVDGITGPNTWNSLETQGATTAAGVGAQVTYTVSGTNNIASADSSGNYTITGLPANTYSLVYSLANYSSQTKSVTVTGGQTTTVNVTLQHS